ncbi:uncharacterized protein LOC119676072 [Teleopsis dalmanni]|uniref:uncharacterized protein LOC119676072 n=1 Tax=Teleopsis dalmanni TaxID=139649 RepID=UPI0018CD5DDC|nr:uncharacterized protein LOC119676072 [Teleopsis dalmanni]
MRSTAKSSSLMVFREDLNEVPSFRIIAPQNICKQDSNATALKLPDGITVSFQPKDGFKLSYKFRIFFKTIGPEIFTQRETLIVWKAVRALEQRLNTKDRLTISKDNMVFISKAEVVAGVSYIFHVYGITDAGETTKEQVFTIQYSNGVFQNENVPEGINLLLIGSETTVAASKYSLHAKVSFCKPKFNYFEALLATNDKNGFKGFRKQFSGRFKRLVAKKPEPVTVIPPELKPQLKTIYVY